MYRYIRYTVYDIRYTTFSYIVYITLLYIDHHYQYHDHLDQQLVGLTITVSKWEFNPESDSVVNEGVYCNTIKLLATSVLDEVAELRTGLADRKQTRVTRTTHSR